MANNLGWKYYATLQDAYDVLGTSINPAVGTVNEKMVYDSTQSINKRVSIPIIHKDSTADYTTDTINGESYQGEPIAGTVVGTEQGCYVKVRDNWPSEDIPTGLITDAQFEALGWRPDAE